MIYTFNNVGNVLYSVAKESFKMSDKQVYDMIQQEFVRMKKRLKQKGIEYENLKKALVPNAEKSRHEICLIFDKTLIKSTCYGKMIFEKLIPLLDKKSVYSILVGDYIDNEYTYSQNFLFKAMNEVVTVCNDSTFLDIQQYYLIYLSNIGNEEIDNIIKTLTKSCEFYGYAYLDHNSVFKSYLSRILISECIKYKNYIISSHPNDYDDSENVKMKPFPYDENGFSFISVNEESYEPFLHYKIESIIPDPEDIEFCFNALFPKFDSIEKLNLVISDDKYFNYLITDKTGKDGILSSLGFDESNKEKFEKEVYEKIRKNYIYNLDYLEDHNVYKFNICIEFRKNDGNMRKVTVAFKYLCESGEIFLITFF